MAIESSEAIVRKLKSAGDATKKLVQSLSHASGAVIGGAETPPPPVTPPTKVGL